MFDCAAQLQQTKHTFFSEISSSRIDRIYASNDVNVVSVRVSPNHFSDHNALIAQLDIPLQAAQLQQTKHTFFSEISSSRIDRIYASNDVNVVSVRVSPNHFSDHNALIAQIDIPLQASRGKGYWKNNVTCYENEAFFYRFRNKMENLEKKAKQFEPCRVVDPSQIQS